MSSSDSKSSIKTILTLGYFILFGNGPWLIAVLYSTILGYIIIPLMPKDALNFYSSIVVPSLPLSLILSSWIQVIVTKKIFDYEALRKIYSARRLILYSIILVFLVVSGFYVVFYVVQTFVYLNPVNMNTLLYSYLLTFVLSLVWVGLAPLNGLQKYFHMTVLFFLGMLFSGISTYFLVVYSYPIDLVIISYAIGYFISAVAMYVYLLFGVFRAPKLAVKLDRALVTKIIEASKDDVKGEKLAKLLPTLLKVQQKMSPGDALIILDKAQLESGRAESFVEMLSGNTALLLANIFYFVFIWLDRFVVWAISGISVTGLFLGFNSIYDVGINIAQWVLIPTVGLAAYLMSDFTPTLLKSLEKLYSGTLDEIKKSLDAFLFDIYYRAFLIIVFAGSVSLVIFIFSDHLLNLFNLLLPTSKMVLMIGLVGVVFHALLIYDFLVLMYIQQLKDDSIVTLLALLVSFSITLFSSLFVNYYLSILGYTVGALVGSITGLLIIRKRIRELYYHFLSKAI